MLLKTLTNKSDSSSKEVYFQIILKKKNKLKINISD